jgi:uracil-DNA glycosylase
LSNHECPKKLGLIDTARHTVVQSAHPSPLAAKAGFFGSRPFSRINAALKESGQSETGTLDE